MIYGITETRSEGSMELRKDGFCFVLIRQSGRTQNYEKAPEKQSL